MCDGVGGASWQRSLLYKDRQESHDCQRFIILRSSPPLGQTANPLFTGNCEHASAPFHLVFYCSNIHRCNNWLTDVPVGTHHQQPSVQPVLQHHSPVRCPGLCPLLPWLQNCSVPVLEITIRLMLLETLRLDLHLLQALSDGLRPLNGEVAILPLDDQCS